MLLGLVLAVATAPPQADAVGVVWSEATVEPRTRQRVLAAVAGAEPGARLVDDADRRARSVVAYEVDRALVERQRARVELLERAEAEYRAGAAADALADAGTVVEGARSDPDAPGVVALLVRAHLLRAQIHWNEGDAAASDAEIAAALAFDPDARVTTRRMPPDLVARYQAQRELLDATRATWRVPDITVGDDAIVELDGRVGVRPVPPGAHHVVVRRPGARPVGAFVEDRWVPPPADETLALGLPVDAEAAQQVCDALDLRVVVLLRIRGERAGVQEFRCGTGFAAPWYGALAEIGDGALRAGAAEVTPRATEMLADDRLWPLPRIIADARPGEGDKPEKKPWWKRGWVWGTLGALVVGGVITGAVLGTRGDEPAYAVDADSFLGR